MMSSAVPLGLLAKQKEHQHNMMAYLRLLCPTILNTRNLTSYSIVLQHTTNTRNHSTLQHLLQVFILLNIQHSKATHHWILLRTLKSRFFTMRLVLLPLFAFVGTTIDAFTAQPYHTPSIHRTIRYDTKLYKKWSPRWNPRPDSDFYKRDGDSDGNGDMFGGFIHSGSQARKRRSKFVAIFGKNGILSLQRILVLINVACFVKQITSAITYLPALNKALRNTNFPYGGLAKLDIIEQSLLGTAPIMIESKAASFPFLAGVPIPKSLQSRAYGEALTVASSLGPFTMDFVNQRLLTRLQPHRYLTSGFLHGSLIHLLFNMRYLWKIPRWVEDNGGTGNGKVGGWPLYLATYLSSILAGNFARDYFSSTAMGASTLCLGASGGICGLNGLMFAMLRRMGNNRDSTLVLKDMAFLILFGQLMDGVSNASHIGGFICGAAFGWLFGPNYSPGYSSWRLSMDDNEPSLDYRRVMGSGINPDKPDIPLRYAFGVAGLTILLRPELRAVFGCIIKGFKNPGALSGMIMN
jgi:membrane associated rhomboid family serine protease